MALQDGFSPSYWQKETGAFSSSWSSSEIPTTIFHTIKYIINVWNDTENKNKSMELVVIKNGSSMDTIISNKSGNAFNLSVDAIVTNNKMHVELMTNETYQLNVELLYVILGN